MALRNVLCVVHEAYVHVSTCMQKRSLVGQPLPSGEGGACHSAGEAMLLGFCLLRFGAAEAALYDMIMARIERRQQADLSRS